MNVVKRAGRAARRRVDPVTVEVLRNALVAIAEQMAACIFRSSHSAVIRDMLDYSTAVFDAQGGIIAQAARIPIHLNSMTTALQTLLAQRFPLSEWADGDVFCMNDPYQGGQHLPDIMTFTPVYAGDRIVAICGTLGHHLDVGGRAPGSYGADATEIYQEGFRIPPCRIVERGVTNELFFDLFAANIRVPSKTVADLRAQIAALDVGKAEVLRLVTKYGGATLADGLADLADRSEERMRAAIDDLRDGVYEAEDYVDGDGLDDVPILVKVKVTVAGTDLTIDFTGSATQSRGPVNAPIAATESAVYYTLIALLDPTIPPNYGCYKPIHLVAPAGTVVNPRSPAPVVGRNVVAHRIVTVLMQALGPALPHRAPAAYYGNSNVYVLSTTDESGLAHMLFEIEVGGWGGRPESDGPDFLSASIHNLANNPIELAELEFPARFTRYELLRDSGGPGRFRGGLALRRDFVILQPSAINTQFDRIKFPPPGLHGGRPGAPARIVVQRGDQEIDLPAKTLTYALEPGDEVSIQTQGGGGYGDPRERDPALVARDLAEGKISAMAAKESYGYVVR